LTEEPRRQTQEATRDEVQLDRLERREHALDIARRKDSQVRRIVVERSSREHREAIA
jgi:hypothetical protein